jgi:PhnB protein
MAAASIRSGFHTVTPFLMVQGAERVIHFMKQTFGANEHHRATNQDESIMHAELQIGDSVLMLSEARGDLKPMPGMLYIYVDDVDVVYERALQAGATSLRPPTDEFYGDRSSGVEDMCGNQWWIATHKEDVPPDEMMRRQGQLMATEGQPLSPER